MAMRVVRSDRGCRKTGIDLLNPRHQGRRALRGVVFLGLALLVAGCGHASSESDAGAVSNSDGLPTPDVGGHDGTADGRQDRVDVGVPQPPRLIAPLSTATVTSRRPTLKWELPVGTDGAHVQICRDRACKQEVTSFDAAGSNGGPTSDLPPGTLFWRTFARHTGTTALDSSPTWQFVVGARTAPKNTSWGTTLDVNGDGYADAAVGADAFYNNDVGKAFLYLGGPTGLASSPTVTLSAPDSQFFGTSIASAGDVNGDGYADLIVGTNYGLAYLYLGSAAGLNASPDTTLIGPNGAAFGLSVASAGDMDGDGYGDVVSRRGRTGIAFTSEAPRV